MRAIGFSGLLKMPIPFQGTVNVFKANGLRTVLATLSFLSIMLISRFCLSLFVQDPWLTWVTIIVPAAVAAYVTFSKSNGQDIKDIFWKEYLNLSYKKHAAIISISIALYGLIKLPDLIKAIREGSLEGSDKRWVPTDNQHTAYGNF